MLQPDFTLPSRKKDARGVSMWLSNVLKTETFHCGHESSFAVNFAVN